MTSPPNGSDNEDRLKAEWRTAPDPILSDISYWSEHCSYDLTLVSDGVTYAGTLIPFQSFTEDSVEGLRGAFGPDITGSKREMVEKVLDLTFRTGQHAITDPSEDDDDEPSEESLMPRRFMHLRDVVATGGGFGTGGVKLERVRLPIAHVSAWFIGRLDLT